MHATAIANAVANKERLVLVQKKLKQLQTAAVKKESLASAKIANVKTALALKSATANAKNARKVLVKNANVKTANVKIVNALKNAIANVKNAQKEHVINANAKIEVRVTDRFGNVYTQKIDK